MVSKFFGTLKNVYNFFVLYSNQDDIKADQLTVDYDKRPELDRWILSKYNQLIKDVNEYMDSYDHMKTVRAITEFVAEDLSNWYIRRARRRFYAEEMTEDKKSVYATTYEVLVGTAKLIAPIAPFLADEIYTNLTGEEKASTWHTSQKPMKRSSTRRWKREWTLSEPWSPWEEEPERRRESRSDSRFPRSWSMESTRQTIEDLTPLIMEELNVKTWSLQKIWIPFYELQPETELQGGRTCPWQEDQSLRRRSGKENAAEFVGKMETEGKVILNLDGEDFNIEKDFVDVRISAKTVLPSPWRITCSPF